MRIRIPGCFGDPPTRPRQIASRLTALFYGVTLAGIALMGPSLLAQNGARPGGAREVKFEVLSIRPLQPGLPSNQNFNPTPNGFASRLSIWQAIMIAYGPANYVNWGSVEILKGPSWLGDFYDIQARVSQADLKDWQSQGRDHELLRSAMRAALKERCKLAIHEQPAKAEVFELVIGKRGPRLTESPRGRAVPNGLKLPSGGVLVQTEENGRQVKTYHGATTQDLTDFLCIMSGRTPVRDRTGLTGHYDFRIEQTPPQPDENKVYSYSVSHLGLEVKLGTENRPSFIIDHIEKPTPNQ